MSISVIARKHESFASKRQRPLAERRFPATRREESFNAGRFGSPTDFPPLQTARKGRTDRRLRVFEHPATQAPNLIRQPFHIQLTVQTTRSHNSPCRNYPRLAFHGLHEETAQHRVIPRGHIEPGFYLTSSTFAEACCSKLRSLMT